MKQIKYRNKGVFLLLAALSMAWGAILVSPLAHASGSAGDEDREQGRVDHVVDLVRQGSDIDYREIRRRIISESRAGRMGGSSRVFPEHRAMYDAIVGQLDGVRSDDQVEMAVVNARHAFAELRDVDPKGATLFLTRYAYDEIARKLGREDLARRLLLEAIDVVEAPAQSLEAYRMLMYIEYPANPDAALEVCFNLVELFYASSEETQSMTADTCAQALNYAASIYSMQGDRQRALEIQTALASSVLAERLVPISREMLWLEIARSYAALGRHEDADVAYSEFQSRYPDHGADRGMDVFLYFEHAKALSGDPYDPKVLAKMDSIVKDSRWAERPGQVARIAHELASRYRQSGQTERYEHTVFDLRNLVEQSGLLDDKVKMEQHYIDDIYAQTLHQVANIAASRKDLDMEIDAVSTFIRQYPDHPAADTMRRRLVRLDDKHEISEAAGNAVGERKK